MWIDVLPWVLLVVVLLWSMRDRGHRCFGVTSERATIAVGQVLATCSLRERFTFWMTSRAGGVVQTLFGDGKTVLMRMPDQKTVPETDGSVRPYGPCALSLTTWHPQRKAQRAADILVKAGFTAEIDLEFVPELGGKFVLLRSDAFDGWDLAFRRPVPFMGKPPKMHKIMKGKPRS